MNVQKLTRKGGGEEDNKKHVSMQVHITRYPVNPTMVSSMVQNRQPHVSAKLLLTLNWARQNAIRDNNWKKKFQLKNTTTKKNRKKL